MRRVLIVDDNEGNVYYLETLLRASGYDVASARNGAEALLIARRSPPDLVISDLLMPVMDGYSLLRRWKADEALRHAPFIVCTATYTKPEDEELALDLGADAFILKPCEPEDILAVVENTQTPREPPSAGGPSGDADEITLLKSYSEALIRKLEERTIQLEESNRLLRADIQVRVEAELALHDSEARFQQLAENVDEVFWLCDRDWQHIFYVSPAYARVWQQPCETVYSNPRSWFEAVHPEDKRRLEAAIARHTTGSWESTHRIIRPDGSTRWIRSRANPILDEQGVPYRYAGVSKDVTEIRLLEDQVRQAQKMEAVGRLASGVAHDFNNLLSVILSYTTLILDEPDLSPTTRDDLEEIYAAGERAANLTRQLLAFGRQQMLDPTVVDLRTIVSEMRRMLGTLLGEDVDLTVLSPDEPCAVFADRGQMEQIVMNLVVNARDAMPSGGQLTVELANVDLSEEYASSRLDMVPGPHVLLAVTDTGEGMNSETIDRIFEPFFTTKELGKGTGLGLSTVFGVVKQSHGHIHVYSEVGIGSTFKVYLPATQRSDRRSQISSPTQTVLTGTETVLVVEDDDQVRAMTRTILRNHGYDVIEASGGAEAIQISDEFDGRIHLLLTDVVMPQMNGRQLAERLSPIRPDMLVLYVSGYTENAIVQHGVLDPGVAFLQKPITPEALLVKVRTVLQSGSA